MIFPLLLATAAGLASPVSRPDCTSILPGAPKRARKRALEPDDLVRLRDIGPIDPEPFATPFFAISPDGTKAAFQLRRADPAANGYCLAMIVVPLVPGARPTIVDEGGELLLLSIDLRGAGDFPTGITSVIAPQWSPDGKWIAFLRRDGQATQVWRAMADGSGSAPLTRSPIDVADFRVSPDGSAIAYSARPSLDQAHEAGAVEGLAGFHYDGRYSPFASSLPYPTAPVPRAFRAIDIASGQERAATAEEEAELAGASPLIATAGAPASSGRKDLWIDATELSGGARPNSLHAAPTGGTPATCPASECEGALKPWWMPGGASVRFFRREGPARASTAIYDWDIQSGKVRRVYLTEDVLADCVPQGEAIICLRDSSLSPRRLERLDPRTGARELLFDPNPEFGSLRLGSVKRLSWRNAFGLETIADLVYPVGYRRGRRYPLVVVQYDTRGFLWGGTGDEYPIQAFANRGYAVLSFRRPQATGDANGAATFTQGRRLNLMGFSDRKSVQSSLEIGVALAVRQGVADGSRVGITGLSDGASSVTWSLIHGSLFRAAAISTCCIDTTLAMRVGPEAARDFLSVGYPGMLERNDPFWKGLSLSANARTVSTPLLMQLADDEYLNALESYSTLREARQPVDLFVFPDEHHVKWQPAHRLAIYRRSIDWFDYWLRGFRSPDPARQADLRHWDELRAGLAPARRD